MTCWHKDPADHSFMVQTNWKIILTANFPPYNTVSKSIYQWSVHEGSDGSHMKKRVRLTCTDRSKWKLLLWPPCLFQGIGIRITQQIYTLTSRILITVMEVLNKGKEACWNHQCPCLIVRWWQPCFSDNLVCGEDHLLIIVFYMVHMSTVHSSTFLRKPLSCFIHIIWSLLSTFSFSHSTSSYELFMYAYAWLYSSL